MQLFKIPLQFLFIIQSLLIIDCLFIPTFFESKQSSKKIISAKSDAKMPEPVRKALQKDGDKEIIRIQLGRTPVQAMAVLILQLLSAGKFSKKTAELGYDEIFHNYLLVTIVNNEQVDSTENTTRIDDDLKVYVLEKAQRIRLRKPTIPDEFEDIYEIPLTPNKTLTLNRLITTASNVDQNFYSYDAANNNMCQTFVENIIDINGLSKNIVDNATRIALKPQDAKSLVDTLGARKDIVKTITDAGAKVDEFIYDKNIKLKKPPLKQFNLLGNMHVKLVKSIGKQVGIDLNNPINTKDVIKENQEKANVIKDASKESEENTVFIDGLADIVIENSDEIYQAVRDAESGDESSQQNQLDSITNGCAIKNQELIVLMIIFFYFKLEVCIL